MTNTKQDRAGSPTSAVQTVNAATSPSVSAWTVAFGLRQRRAASLRLTPLPCGHRDLLDCLADDDLDLDCDLAPDGGWCPSRALDYQEREYIGRELAASGWVA